MSASAVLKRSFVLSAGLLVMLPPVSAAPRLPRRYDQDAQPNGTVMHCKGLCVPQEETVKPLRNMLFMRHNISSYL